MKQLNYVGAEGECIVITQPTDIYPLLDWCQSRMLEKQLEEDDFEKWEEAINYLSELMSQAEEDGFGSHEDVENIEY
jgi:hypothetical protein